MQKVGDKLKDYQSKTLRRASATRSHHRLSHRHQFKAWEIARKLNDRAHYGLYAFWCKSYSDSVIDTALARTQEANPEDKGRYFTKMVQVIGGPLPAEAIKQLAEKRRKPQPPLPGLWTRVRKSSKKRPFIERGISAVS